MIYFIVGYNNTRVSVSLKGGRNPDEGRVEVSIGEWTGTVCDDSFGDPDAKVVCRMLEYRSAKLKTDVTLVR